MRWKPHVRFGGRTEETDRWKQRHGAPVRSHIVLVTENRTHLSGGRLFAVQLLLIVATTLASYYLIERPIHLDGFNVNRSLTAALTGTACLAAVVGLPGLFEGAAATGPALSATAHPRSFTAAEVQGLTVMVVGDSWGIRTGSAMARMADPHPKAVVQLGQPSCGIADPVEEFTGSGTSFTPTDRCRAWKTSWTEAMRQKPSFVVMQVGNWDQARQRLTPGGPVLTACDGAFRASYDARLDEAIGILSAAGTPVFVPSVIDNDGVLRARSDCMNSMLRDAVTRHAAEGAHLLDLEGLLCPRHKCVATLGGTRAYDETGHIAPETLPTVNRWIFGEVGAVLGTQVPAADLWPAPGGAGSPRATTPLTPGEAEKAALTADLVAAANAMQSAPVPGQAAPGPMSAPQILSSVDAVKSEPAYQSMVVHLSTSDVNAAYSLTSSTGATRAVGVFVYQADTQADSAAVALQQLMADAGARVTLDTDNLKHFALANTTVSVARSWQRLAVTVITGDRAEARADLARAALGQVS